MNKKQTTLGCSLLIITAFLWGTTFLFQKKGSSYFDAFTFNMFRCLISFIFLFIFILIFRNKEDKYTLNKFKTLLKCSLPIGISLFCGMTFQQLGIKYTSISKGGFLSATYIVFVPIFGLLFHKRINFKEIISIFIVLIGTYLLCFTTDFKINKGDILILICSIGFTLQILFVDKYNNIVNPIEISCAQFFICFLLGIIPSILFKETHYTFNGIINNCSSLLYAGILSGGVAYTLQIIAQKKVNTVVASLLMSLESVFSLIAGWIILKEVLLLREGIGCFLILIGIILTQITFKKKKKKLDLI